jgi:recombination protein RecT
MTSRSTAVVTTESSPEKPAISYALRSPTAAVLNTDEARAHIVPLIARGVSWEEVLLEVNRAATINPDILRCDSQSIIMAVGMAVQTGLVIGKTIHLVPVSGKLQAWTDYKGDIELVLASGAARAVDAQAVYEGDVFEYELGDSPFVKHRPVLGAKRGKLIGAYCIAWLNITGTLKKISVMGIDQIEKIRAKSRSWSPSKVAECPEWYAIKTAVHRNCKALPKNRRLAQVLALFEHQDRIDDAEVEEMELNPANRVDTPATAAIASASDFSSSDEAAKTEPPAPSKASELPLPFGRNLKGTPIGQLDQETLKQAYDWAKQQPNGETEYREFIAAAEELMEARRLGPEF